MATLAVLDVSKLELVATTTVHHLVLQVEALPRGSRLVEELLLALVLPHGFNAVLAMTTAVIDLGQTVIAAATVEDVETVAIVTAAIAETVVITQVEAHRGLAMVVEVLPGHNKATTLMVANKVGMEAVAMDRTRATTKVDMVVTMLAQPLLGLHNPLHLRLVTRFLLLPLLLVVYLLLLLPTSQELLVKSSNSAGE